MDDYSKVPTRLLLRMLDDVRAYMCEGYKSQKYIDIKAELAKRPHIPNKKEGKALRREAARQARCAKNRTPRR